MDNDLYVVTIETEVRADSAKEAVSAALSNMLREDGFTVSVTDERGNVRFYSVSMLPTVTTELDPPD